MDFSDFNRRIEAKRQQLREAVNRRLPIKIGRRAADHFTENFRLGGYVDGGLHPWPKTKRQQSGCMAAAALYGPLLSGRNNLARSIRYVPGEAQVTVGTTVPYAAVHNQGADLTVTTHPRVTPKMRKFAWAKFFEAGGNKATATGASAAGFWKALALTKKEKLSITANVHIPQRRFIGPSKELRQIIIDTITQELRPIINP